MFGSEPEPEAEAVATEAVAKEVVAWGVAEKAMAVAVAMVQATAMEAREGVVRVDHVSYH